MLRIGRMIRSAKMKAIAPPKLMPPFHSTAASGILPTEHTNEITATSGPTIGPHSLASNGWSTTKNDCQKSAGIQAASAPEIKKAACDVHPDRSHVHYEIMADRSKTHVRRDPLPKRAASLYRYIHLRMAFHPAGQALVGLFLCLAQKLAIEKQPKKNNQQRDHDGCADKFGQGELPA